MRTKTGPAQAGPSPIRDPAACQRRYGVPTASYRLQLHAGFGFGDAARVVGYLQRLGVSHLYLSPFFAAAPGSAHGYDVFDHNQVNPELGGLAGLYELSEQLISRDMGLIADFVPNHVGIEGGANPWWRDVLRHGQHSPYADYFDIDWEAQPQMLSGKLVIPVLGKSFGAVLESGELRLEFEDSEPWVRYYGARLPLSPASLPGLLGIPPLELAAALRDPAALPAIAGILDALPRGDHDQAEHLLTRFRALLESEPALVSWVADAIEQHNGIPGHPATFDRLEALILDQHYRLADWRVSGEELNYRRFFDTNSLAAIRVERDDVFENIHRLLLELVGRGIVTGVRIDHIDGLYDPAAYLRRLRARLDEAAPPGAQVPIYVEKVLEESELLPAWPVSGTTGYDFLARVDGLFVDRTAAPLLTQTYEQFVARPMRFHRIGHEARLHVASTAFAGEINVLALQLHRIAQHHRLYRDATLRSLRRAITAVLASFPVYRTYLDEFGQGEGREHILAAVREAERRDSTLSPLALDLLQEVLLLEREGLDADEGARRSHFRRRFQQISGPVMAKGVEDTAFFRYNRLLALNEVGGTPGAFGLEPATAHRWFAERAEYWPAAMSAASTHDTKRSEDVRARLNALTELAPAWRREVTAWRRLNARHRSMVDGEPAPDPNTEFYLYQSLVGAWPPDGISPEFVERIQQHTTKAVREAKAETSWIEPNEPFERAVHVFVSAILDPRRAPAFLRRVETLVARLRPIHAHSALSMLVLRSLAPGFPDIYQGTETETLALTDPDNRRPVNFEELERLLARAESFEAPPAVADPAARAWMTRALLRFRAEHQALLNDADYAPMEASGLHASRVFAFVRRGPADQIAVAVPRLVAPLLDATGTLPPSAWRDTGVALPGPGPWREAFSSATFHGPFVRCEELFGQWPAAVLVSASP